jgi:hypothetical protein
MAFGDKAAWIRSQACVVRVRGVGGICDGAVEAAHVKSRGAGGDSSHLLPLCEHHHEKQHTIGIRTFEVKYGLDLEALAAEYELRWRSLEAGTQEEEK